MLHFIAAGDLDQAQRLNIKNDDAIPRAICYVVGAQTLVKNGDKVRAGEWLREAGMIVQRSEPDETLTRIALGIASTYGRFDTQSAIDWLLYAVKLISNTAPESLGDDRAPSLKRISGITPVTDLGSETTGFSLQAAVAVFPPVLFEQLLSILNEITPREARGIAIVTLATRFLSHKKAQKV